MASRCAVTYIHIYTSASQVTRLTQIGGSYEERNARLKRQPLQISPRLSFPRRLTTIPYVRDRIEMFGERIRRRFISSRRSAKSIASKTILRNNSFLMIWWHIANYNIKIKEKYWSLKITQLRDEKKISINCGYQLFLMTPGYIKNRIWYPLVCEKRKDTFSDVTLLSLKMQYPLFVGFF